MRNNNYILQLSSKKKKEKKNAKFFGKDNARRYLFVRVNFRAQKM